MTASQITRHGASRVQVTLPGAELAALRAQPAEPVGAVAVLVPGYTGSKEDFSALLNPLCSAGLSVLALDLPGQYESPGPGCEQDYYPDPLGRTVAALVAELAAGGDRVLLLGHSYGGLVCRSAVLAGAPVTGLTLLDSGPGALPQGERRALIDATEPVMRAEGIETVQRLLEARDGIAEPPELAALLRARFLRSSTVGLLGMATGLRTEPDRVTELAAALRTGPIPCLVVFGESDDAWPVAVQRDMADRLGAAVAMIPDAAHSPSTENPQALLDVLLPIWMGWLA
ncbi:MAG: alpha/beta hydrolase [Pseudonocardiales bacterium]|nr:alpha/beta hydrolase [Actinomycetota bacterium]PZS18654.1 MAG: alpha/beta hydrolase [Pseudonocardiales bacterium]